MSKIALQGNVSGTGTISLVAPNTSTDRTLTLPDEAGTIITSGSPTVLPKGVPAFAARIGSSTSISSSVYTKVPFDTELFDTNSFFDNTTNYRFQPTIAGYYQINFVITANTPSMTIVILTLFKNGGEYLITDNRTSYSGNVATNSLSDVVYMNGSSNYLECYAYVTGTSPVLFGSATYSRFSGVLVRAD